MFVHESRLCGRENNCNIGIQSTRSQTERILYRRLAPVPGTEAQRILGKFCSAFKHWRPLGKEITSGPSASSITAMLQEQRMELQEWIIELLLKPHLPSQYTFSVIPR